jgi:hypothetical protein
MIKRGRKTVPNGTVGEVLISGMIRGGDWFINT